MVDDLVRVTNLQQCDPLAPGCLLAAASSPAPAPQAHRRERLGGVPRVAAQSAFQLQDLGPQLLDHPGLLDQREKVLT
jgi:hypothetical protein